MTTDAESMVYGFDEFRVDAGKRLVFRKDGTAISLTPKIFDTLLYLVGNSGRLIDKDELMSAIWSDTIVEENNLNKNISVLRRVLGENPGEHRFIVTVPGKGYKFVAAVRKISNDRPSKSTAPDDQLPGSKRSEFRFAFAVSLAAILITAIVAGSFYWLGRSPGASNDVARTIAILPFRPLVPENRDEALELGMADTLISRLGNNREIVVRPLSSVRTFGNLDQDALEAGRVLGVESVMEGTIQRWGDKIRVNVRLLKVADGTVLWTETFDEKFTDIFVVQDAISSRVSSALAVRLSQDEKTILEKRYTTSAKAYALYLRGRYHVFKVTEAEIRKGIGFYEEAVEADPNYALAYAAMADAYRTLASASFSPSKEACPRAKALALKALEIDESLAEAHIVLGWIGFLYDWDWPAAETALKRALELSPNNSEAHRAYGHLLSNSGRHEEAIGAGRRARELAPLTLITLTLEGQFLVYAGRDDEAVQRLNHALELDENFWVARNVLGRLYLRQGRLPEAIAELRRAQELARGSSEALMQLGYGLAKSGDIEGARSVNAELEAMSKTRYVLFYNFALVHNGLGETDAALDYLERSVAEREIPLAFLKVDTRWDNWRSEPRFIEIIRQLNFGA